jgi:hypothetical protein
LAVIFGIFFNHPASACRGSLIPFWDDVSMLAALLRSLCTPFATRAEEAALSDYWFAILGERR